MKIAVFGASGKTGIKIVEQALSAGHEVKAFVRDPKKLTIQNEKLEVVQGDVLDAEAVEKAVEGVGAVLVALGGGPDSSPTMHTDGTQNIVNAMKKFGVNRIIVEGSYAMGSEEGMQMMKGMMGEEKVAGMKGIYDDKFGQAKVLADSGLNWTLVLPSFLTDGEKTGTYRTGESIEITPENNISRADVASFMLKQIGSEEFVNKTVIISY